MDIALLIPPSIDWNMPLIAMPLLKAYLPEEWNIKVIDINAKLFSKQFDGLALSILKQQINEAIETKNLENAVETYLAIEDTISLKKIGNSILHGRSLHIIDKWFDSNAVYEYLQKKTKLKSIISNLLSNSFGRKSMDVIGISISVEEQIVPSFIISSIMRKHYPETKIILGGNIISRLYENIMNSSLQIYFDLLLIGEGESIFENAILYLMKEGTITNKVYMNNINENSEYFQNLRTPIFEDICWNDYISPTKMLPITAQRKCRWSKCDFCAIHSCWTYGVRERNVDSVVDEIEYLSKKYDVNYFRIVDEMVSAEYLFNLSKLLLSRKIKINYEAYARFEETYTNEFYIKTLFDGGCRQLFWGIENINDNALKFMNKGTNRALIDKCLQLSSDAGITNYCFLLMGIPCISQSTEKETIDYACNNYNIQVGVAGSFVIDRLSPMHLDERMHSKYDITLFEIGNLTTEVGYLKNGVDERGVNKQRTAQYIRELYMQRPDYAICSLLSEEARLVLTTIFGNKFALNYVEIASKEKIMELIEKSTAHLIEERVNRRTEEV